MNKNGPVIIIEDDKDDQFILDRIFKDLKYENKIVFCDDGASALEYLNKTEVLPFLILSDINMPKINGLELRSKVRESELLHVKCIPYLFFTTTSSRQAVSQAYAMSVQGFFVKPHSIEKLEATIRKIMEYWKECVAPNDGD